MDESEADELLDLLFDHQLKIDFQYHHKRHENDVVMSDNIVCCTRGGGRQCQHPDVRLLDKTVVAGDGPRGQ